MNNKPPKDVDSYIAQTPKEVQPILKELRQVIQKAAPKATERLSYGMPFYEYGGTGIKGRLIYFAVYKKHISLFITPWGAKTLPSELKQYHTTKATYQFPLDQKFPFALIAETVKKMVEEREQ